MKLQESVDMDQQPISSEYFRRMGHVLGREEDDRMKAVFERKPRGKRPK